MYVHTVFTGDQRMKRKVWRSGNSWVVTIPNEIAEKFDLMNKKLIDFDIKNVFEETEKMFDDLFSSFGNNFVEPMKNHQNEMTNRFRQPLADLRETENEYIALLEIPGVDKKEIQLNITENNLEVKVEKRSEMKVNDEEKGFVRSESVYSGFYRTIRLPSNIIPDRATATYKNGVLEVILPKSFKEKNNGKRIQID